MSHFKLFGLIGLLLIYIITAALTSVTLTPQKIEDSKLRTIAASTSTGGKNMNGYIADIWPTKIIPEFKKDAVELTEVITGLKQNPKVFAKKHGRRSNDFSPMNYIVKGKALVKQVNIKSPAGKIVLNLKDLSNIKEVIIQIGPVIKKSSIRDSLSFISFNDFVNQIEFGEFSKEIKNYVINNVVNTVRDTNLVGKEVEFIGAFTYDKRGKILITPVEISFKGK